MVFGIGNEIEEVQSENLENLLVEGYEDEMVLEVENGETSTGSISLEPGRYILYCDIAGHRESGMEAQLLVE